MLQEKQQKKGLFKVSRASWVSEQPEEQALSSALKNGFPTWNDYVDTGRKKKKEKSEWLWKTSKRHFWAAKLGKLGTDVSVLEFSREANLYFLTPCNWWHPLQSGQFSVFPLQGRGWVCDRILIAELCECWIHSHWKSQECLNAEQCFLLF